jgi:lysophospholipase L1-like esterase
MLFRTLLSACFFLLVTPADTSAQDVERSVIVLFGDSITVGENDTSYFSECPKGGGRPGLGLGRGDFCFPDRELVNVLAANNRAAFVFNHGAGGTASGGGSINNGVSRLSSNLAQTTSTAAGKDYFVLILYGTNDQGYGLNRFDTQANINAMISIARQRGFNPIVGSLLPRSTGDSASDNVGQRNVLLQQTAAARGAPFVDLFSAFNAAGGLGLHDPEISRFSGNLLLLHPKKTGYQVIAQTWFNSALAGLIDEIPGALETPKILPPIIYLLLDE